MFRRGKKTSGDRQDQPAAGSQAVERAVSGRGNAQGFTRPHR